MNLFTPQKRIVEAPKERNAVVFNFSAHCVDDNAHLWTKCVLIVLSAFGRFWMDRGVVVESVGARQCHVL